MSIFSLIEDIAYALRSIRRAKGFTATAIATLAIGIGVNAAVFTVTDAALFRGFPHVDPDNRILYLSSNTGTSYADFEDWRAQAKSFSGMGVVWNGGLRLIIRDEKVGQETYDGTELSAGSFRVLREKPIVGRDFEPFDAIPGAAPVAILSYGLWERRYEKDASIIGRTIQINDNPTTVIGVMPEGFDFPHHRVDLWVPLAPTPELRRRDNRRMWFAFGRIADGVTVRSAQAEMNLIVRRLGDLYPETNRGVGVRVEKFRDAFVGPNATALYGSLWGSVGFVLLIACANLANFLLARAIGRSREISVRIALGATRWRIIRQLLIESVMLSSLAAVPGWLVALGGVRAYELLAHAPGSYDRWNYSLDYSVFLYFVSISILAGLLFGLAPAITLSKLDISSTLKDGSRGATSGAGKRRLSTVLIAGEVALAVVMLAGAGVMIRSFLKVYAADIGVKTANILTLSVRPGAPRYPDSPARVSFLDQLAARLRAIPGVDSLALAGSLPGLYAPRLQYELAGTASFDDRNRPVASAVTIGSGYFHTIGAAVLSGREFNDDDGTSGNPVAMVNQRFATRFWPGQNPLGKRLRVFDGKRADAWRTVVGVTSNIVQNDFTGQIFEPVIYVPFRQRPAADMDFDFLARTRVRPEALESAFRQEVQTMDPDLVLYSGLGSMQGPAALNESLLRNNSWSHGFNAGLFLVFAAIALLLASVGLYAVTAHSVSRRTQEIGIRIALGATARDTRKLVFSQGMVPVGIGLATGLAASVVINQLLKTELVNVSPTDPFTLFASTVALLAAAMLACLIPAQRAVRVDPAISLRHE